MQVGYRSAGDLASALEMTRSMASGSSGRRSRSEGGDSESWAHMRAMFSLRRKGGWPVSISTTAQARAYWSARPSMTRPSICSGAT